MNDSFTPNPYDSPLPTHGDEPTEPARSTLGRPTSVRWRILLLLMVFAALFHFNRVSISVAGSEHLMEEFELSKPQMGVVYSSYLFVYTLFMIPGGWIIDRFGPKRALMIVGFGSVLLVPMTGLTKFAPTSSIDIWPFGPVSSVLIWLCLIRGLLGMISAPFHPGAARATSFWQPAPFRTTANGLITGAAVLGIASTYVVFGFLMDKLGWPLAFVAAGVVTLLLIAVWTIYAADSPRRHLGANESECALIEGVDTTLLKAKPAAEPAKPKPEPLGGLLGLFLNRSLMLVTLSYAAYSYFQYLFFYWVQNYYDDVLKFSSDESRKYATITTLAMAVGMIVGGIAADQFQRWWGFKGRAIVPIVGMIGGGLFLFAGISVTHPIVVVACFAMANGSLGLAEAPFWMTGVEVGRRRGGLSGAFLNTGGNAGGILGPVITPLIAGEDDWKTGLMLAGVICIIGALLWLGIRPPREVAASD